MVGLSKVADQVDSLVSLAEIEEKRRLAGLPTQSNANHLVFVGNPGTGKTTVANEIAHLYHAIGVTPKDTVLTVDKGTLTDKYANSIENNVTDVFNKARGGVLFVDEAYALADDEFGRRAATQLMKLMEEHKDDTVVIVAGYPGEMDKFMDINPGMRSRFARTIEFPDYSDKELVQILGQRLDKNRDQAGDDEASGALARAAVIAGKAGGNGRAIERLHSNLNLARAQRLRGTNASDDELRSFTTNDVKAALRRMDIEEAEKGKRS